MQRKQKLPVVNGGVDFPGEALSSKILIVYAL